MNRHKPILAGLLLTGIISATLLQSSTAATLNLTNSTTSTTEAWTINGNVTIDGQGNVALSATPPGSGGGCTGPGTLGFSSSSYSVAEGSSTNITVNRTGCSQGAVTVNYASSDGTAVAGTDYNTASGILSWNDTELGSKTFAVTTLGESPAVTEPNKTVSLALSGITGGATLGTAAAILTINDVGSSNCPAPPSNLTLRDATQIVDTTATYKSTAGQAVAIKFTPGSSGSVYYSSAQVSGVTTVSQNVSISSCRGDFTQTYPCAVTGTQEQFITTTASTAPFYVCKLTAGQSYYVNVRNAPTLTGADSCPAGKTCGLILTIK